MSRRLLSVYPRATIYVLRWLQRRRQSAASSLRRTRGLTCAEARRFASAHPHHTRSRSLTLGCCRTSPLHVFKKMSSRWCVYRVGGARRPYPELLSRLVLSVSHDAAQHRAFCLRLCVTDLDMYFTSSTRRKPYDHADAKDSRTAAAPASCSVVARCVSVAMTPYSSPEPLRLDKSCSRSIQRSFATPTLVSGAHFKHEASRGSMSRSLRTQRHRKCVQHLSSPANDSTVLQAHTCLFFLIRPPQR